MEFLYQATRKGGVYPPTSAFPSLGHEWLSQSISAVASASLAQKRRTQFDTFHQETLERHGIETEYHGVDWTRMPDVTHEADVQMEEGVQGHEASHQPPPPPPQPPAAAQHRQPVYPYPWSYGGSSSSGHEIGRAHV